MSFIYTISSKDNSFSNKFIINAERKLSSGEIENLKLNPEALKAFKQRDNIETKIITLDWKDLNIEMLPTENLQGDASLSVSEIAIGNMKKLKSPALITRLENLLTAWPAKVPVISLIWKLILTPLIWMGRFLDKNRDVVLHRLEDLDTVCDYNSATDFLKDYQEHLKSWTDRLENNQEAKLEEFKNYLLEMKRQATILESGMKKPNQVLYNLCRDLVKEGCKKLKHAENGKETALMSLPVGFYQKNGKYQPMLATFYLEPDHKLRLDLNCLGNPSLEHLQQSYRFDEPSSALLTDLTHNLCILSFPQKQAKPLQLSYREKIRIKVLHQFTQEGDVAVQNLQDFKKFNAPQWLNESLCVLGGTPLKIAGEEENQDKTLKGIIGHDFTHFFPEAPVQDKLEFLIKLIEENYERFIDARPYLTEAQQSKQFELLKFKVKKLEDHLQKRMDPSDFKQVRKVNQAFDAFFKKIDQLDDARVTVQKSRRLNKASTIDKGMIKSSGQYTLKANIDITKPLEKDLQAEPSKDVLSPYENDLSELSKAIREQNHESTQQLLSKIQEEADKLINKKEYFTAKQLSVQALQYLPIPEGPGAAFWNNAGPSKNTVLQIVKLNKHIWECSLRLQDNAPERNQLLQMIKSQLIVSLWNNIGIDKRGLLDIIKLHPHYRFGWLPSQFAEINQILSFLENYRGDTLRCDIMASSDKLKDNFTAHQAMALLQCTFTCLMKPDYTLYPFFGKGQVNEVMGVNYLDNLVKKAVDKGATNATEKSEMIKAFKYEDIQKRLKKMGRLEIGPAIYVTDRQCIQIYDRFSFLTGGLAYLPNNIWGLGHDAYKSKYTFPNNQANTRELVGAIRGDEKYLTRNDNECLQNSNHMNLLELGILDRERSSTISPQRGSTEPTLLQQNLVQDPRGQINQVGNYVLETLQVALRDDTSLHEALNTIRRRQSTESTISFTSTYEALNLIRTHPYLLHDPEFQKTILLNITRPEFLSKAIRNNPLYFEVFADDLRELMQEMNAQKGVVPFLMLVADTIKEHSISLQGENDPVDLHSLLEKLPSFDAEILLGDSQKTGYEWLHEWMIDQEKDRASTALTFMYANLKKSLNELSSTSDTALLIHAASIFQNSADSIGIPLFNREINDWIQETLIPHIQNQCEQEEGFTSNLLNDWIRLSTGNPGYSSQSWHKKEGNIYENEDFKVDLNSLEIESKNQNYQLAGFVVDLPIPVARSITKLFGLQPIHATLRRGTTINQNYYDFQYKNESYTVFFNQANGDIHIYRQLPIDMRRPEGKKAWFQLVPQDGSEEENFSAIELLIEKNGLWVNTKNPTQSYLFVHAPSEDSKENPYLVSLKSDGTVKNISDPISSLNVVIDQNHHHHQAVPFANPQEAIFLASTGNNLVKEVRFLHDESRLKRKGRGNWVYHNERLGEGYHWLTNLSDEKLFLNERSSAKAFLDSLGDMHEKFVFPLTNEKSHVFIINPYQIKAQKGLAKIDFDQNVNAVKSHQPPLTITFDENGKQEGSPAAFLYLAYYFSHMKNYRMAEHYLNKAKDAAGSSSTDADAVEGLEKLFEQIPLRSLRSVAFQLKAQLTIKHIKTTQLSKTVYEPASSGEFLQNLQHIAKLNEVYEKRSHELKEGALTEEERYEINRYVQMSMRNYVKAYQKKEAGKVETMDVNFSQFEYFNRDVPQDYPNVLKLLLMANLEANPSINKLVEKRNPDPDYILRNFFNFIIAAVNCKPTANNGGQSEEEKARIERAKKANLKKLKLFMAAPKGWELYPPKNEKELATIQMAKFACQYLQRFLENPPGGRSANQIYTELKRLKSGLPYFDRSFGLISLFYDISKGTIHSVSEDQSFLKRTLRDAIGGPAGGFQNRQGTYDPRKTGQNMTTLNTILEVLEDDDDSFFSLSSLEEEKIPEMIHEGDYDLDQPRELLTLVRDSEARQFSVLEMRNDIETLRQINKLEAEIREQAIEEPVSMPPYDLQSIENDFNEMLKAFPALISTDQDKIEKAKETLRQKTEELKTYFRAEGENKKTHLEENSQLQKGLDIAEKKLMEEIQQKSSFTREEITNLGQSIDSQLSSLKENDRKERQQLLEDIRNLDITDPQLKKAIGQPEIYTEYDLFNELLKVYKDPARSKSLGDLQERLTSYLFKYTAYLQFKKAKELLDANPNETNATRALKMVHAALNANRFQEAGMITHTMRICLVAESRDGIIYRQAQLEALQKIKENPNRWDSLIMGLGKTSKIMPTAAEIVAKTLRTQNGTKKKKLVVLTVPEILLKSNRPSMDKASRTLVDLAGVQFSLPLTEELSFSYLAEKYKQLLKVVKDGYVITSVEELCSLHNMIIQLEEEKRKLFKNDLPFTSEQQGKCFYIGKKLHYLRKISQLLHDEAQELHIDRQLLGDEVDTTNDITHEVNLAVGKVVPPSKIVRDAVRTIIELILTSKKGSTLYNFKRSLLEDSQSVLKNEELEMYMHECAKALKQNSAFTKLLGPELSQIVSQLDEEEWTTYMTGMSNKLPETLGAWEDENNGKLYLSATKQLLSETIKNMVILKSGNEFGFSDTHGFLAVPKISKNETPGMRYGDEFELITAQYLAYLEFLPCQSLTDASEKFFEKALKTYQNKYPGKYELLIADFAAYQAKNADHAQISLLEYLKTPKAWKHRFNLLDEIVFDGGYITRFNKQITTNVQEMYHGNMGGMTGTLDPYTLPFISHEVQFNRSNKEEEMTSTREVEAETLLRLTLNLPEGIHTNIQVYDPKHALEYIGKNILSSDETKAFVNNIGITSEGMDTIAWIEKLRKTPEGKERPYLFPHPELRILYLWMPDAKEAVPYKGQELPSNCTCIFLPSDGRGIDQPIGKGDVHYFLGATTSLQELMQILYRARQIGTSQKIILHISKAWENQIKPLDSDKGITYGDIVKYIVSRTADNKEAINERAQLDKITGQLKAVISKYLRQTNPKFDQIDFWGESNLDEFGLYMKQESEIFAAIRHLYIKKKEIDFGDYYEPIEKIAGTQKLLNAYDDLQESINELIEKLPEEIEIEGKSNLREDLEKLCGEIVGEKEKFQEWLPYHERFLPEETVKISAGSKNVKETVKELQMQKVVQVQKEEQPEKIHAEEERKREYIPLNYHGLFDRTGHRNDPVPLTNPFDNLYISHEALEVMNTYDTRRGDPLLYLVMTKEDGKDQPRITLVSKMDYHSVIYPALRKDRVEGQEELYVYSLNMHHFSQIDGTSKNENEVPDQFLGAKCYLGFKEYNKKETDQLKNWIDSLGENKGYLLGYLKEKATQSLYNFVDDLSQKRR